MKQKHRCRCKRDGKKENITIKTRISRLVQKEEGEGVVEGNEGKEREKGEGKRSRSFPTNRRVERRSLEEA
ncbi:MAG: hypothetical protein JWR35_3885 [Marmoricola sp.]|nr:hypothetical protein [Marmoricola sp.]